MNYNTAKTLSDARFKRLVGVKRETFLTMVSLLEAEYHVLQNQGITYMI